MIQKDYLQEIVHQQKEALAARDEGMLRNGLNTLPDVEDFALIVSGI